MIFSRLRLGLAVAVAFLLGMPLAAKAGGSGFDVGGAATDLGFSIADASGGGS